jgi:hypothetical protein
VEEVAEIVMRRHLAAIDGAGLAHPCLHEGMPGLREDRVAAGARHGLGRGPGHARVEHDRGARLERQRRAGEKRHDILAVDEVAGLVEEEAAVEVAVPGDSEIRAGRADGLGRHRAVLGQERVRDAVREGRVGCVAEPRDLDRPRPPQ